MRGEQRGHGVGCRALAALAVLWATTGTRAEEVVVQNDSVTDESQAVIVGDFIGGEEAGARLTAPCDGAIVAVQILWLEGLPGSLPSLEEAIRIYDGTTFPQPGETLALLEGPVLTPGGLNEFRYLDEAGTIPLDVPVSFKQNFTVALEFYNPTDVGGGGPSVVRDLDGCKPGRNLLYAIPGGWLDFCLLLEGDLVIRAVVDCQDPSGACCDAEAQCFDDIEQDLCQGSGQTFFEGQSCAEVTCPPPTGACCSGSGGCLDGIEQAFCEDTLGGVYAGNGSLCDDDVCDPGACCLPDGSCEEVIEITCGVDGGAFQGVGSSCVSVDCPQPLGACCIGEVCVPEQTEENCISFEGQWLGMLTDCGPPNPCVQSPAIVTVESCLPHDGVEYCLDLGTGQVAGDNVEPRLGRIGKLVATLDGAAPASPVAHLDCGSGELAGVSASADGQAVVVTVDPALPNAQCCTLTIDEVEGAWSVVSLQGDLTRDGLVNSVDASAIKPHFGAAAAAGNFILDVDGSGLVNSVDSSAVKPHFGTTSPDCP